MPMPQPGRRLRKREVVFAVALGALAAGGAALILEENDGSGPVPVAAARADNLTYDVAEFEEISTVGPQDVVITRGDTYSVRSEGSPEALGQLEVVVDDGELTIRPKDQFRVNWPTLSSATFYVTVPRLERVSQAGSGDVSVDRIEGDEFEGTIAGRGKLTIADMQVDEADFRIGGSGNVVAAGTAREASVSIGGSGRVQAGGLRSETATVSVFGSGDVALTVEDEAQVSIAGSGDVDISGPARCSVSRMGSGNVRCSSGDTD
jgi:hypothetical protein